MRSWTTAALVIATLAGCRSNEAQMDPSSYPDISVAAAAKLCADDPDVVVLDIRTPEEFAAGHIAGALSVDSKSPDFVDRLKQLDRSKTYVMH